MAALTNLDHRFKTAIDSADNNVSPSVTGVRRTSLPVMLACVVSVFIAGNCVAVEPYTIFDPLGPLPAGNQENESSFAGFIASAFGDELGADEQAASEAPDSESVAEDSYLDELDLDEYDLDEDAADDEDPTSRLNRSIFGDVSQRVPTFDGGRFVLPSLMAATTDTAEIGNGRMPKGFREGQAAPVISLPESLYDRGLPTSWTIRHWAAPNTFALPRYFEDRMLERHGHETLGCLQPIASGTHFFATLPMLPYLMVVDHPCECEYQLGYYRPGSCTPMLKQRPPYECRAAITEAAAIAGGMLLIP